MSDHPTQPVLGTDPGTGATPEGDLDRARLEEVIDTMIRPALQADGGDLELDEVTGDGVVRVKLAGACGTCPISSAELKGGVERILKERVPGVTEVVDVSDEGTVLSLG